jgi:hypothetical protein
MGFVKLNVGIIYLLDGLRNASKILRMNKDIISNQPK